MSLNLGFPRLQSVADAQETKQYVNFSLTSGAMSENGATTWVTPIQLGTPGQTLNVMLDSGTLNTWVTDATCTTDACKLHGAFNTKESSSFIPSAEPSRTVDFGPWGSMDVKFGTDHCTLQSNTDGTILEDMYLMLAQNYQGSDFADLVSDGGFAIPSIPDKEATALVNQLFAQGLISAPIASFYLDRAANVGECRMGSINTDLFDILSLQKLELVTPTGGEDLAYLWAVSMESVEVGDNQVYGPADNTQLVLDTGSSFFKGAEEVIDPLIKAVTNNHQLPTRFTDSAELANYAPLTLTLSGKQYVLQPEQYFTLVGNEYVLAIQVLIGMPERMLLVGDIFLETVYTVFDFGIDDSDERGIYLAKPKLASKPDTDVSGETLIGDWVNQFGSVMSIKEFRPDGVFTGTYSSDTGASGIYPLVGTADPSPRSSQALSFAVTWRSMQGAYDPSWHWTSAFAGFRQDINNADEITGTFLLQKEVSDDSPAYEATAVSSLTFKRKV